MKSPKRRKSPAVPSSPAAVITATDENERQANTPNSNGREYVPPQWAWHYRMLVHLRDRLMRTHAEHTRDAAVPVETHGVDLAETAQEHLDRDLLWAELGHEDDQLFEVDCALQRIRDGVYGFCEQTGHAIPSERLRAIPWTRYCRTAAEEHEKKIS